MFVEQDFDMVVTPWWGPGILRVAPTGAPWSLWYFFTEGWEAWRPPPEWDVPLTLGQVGR